MLTAPPSAVKGARKPSPSTSSETEGKPVTALPAKVRSATLAAALAAAHDAVHHGALQT